MKGPKAAYALSYLLAVLLHTLATTGCDASRGTRPGIFRAERFKHEYTVKGKVRGSEWNLMASLAAEN